MTEDNEGAEFLSLVAGLRVSVFQSQNAQRKEVITMKKVWESPELHQIGNMAEITAKCPGSGDYFQQVDDQGNPVGPPVDTGEYVGSC
jgi:hypothetical protein